MQSSPYLDKNLSGDRLELVTSQVPHEIADACSNDHAIVGAVLPAGRRDIPLSAAGPSTEFPHRAWSLHKLPLPAVASGSSLALRASPPSSAACKKHPSQSYYEVKSELGCIRMVLKL